MAKTHVQMSSFAKSKLIGVCRMKLKMVGVCPINVTDLRREWLALEWVTDCLWTGKLSQYTVSQKKRHPFYFCDIFVRFHPILLIFGRNIPPGNLKQAHVHDPHHILFYMFVLYLVKTGDASEHTL